MTILPPSPSLPGTPLLLLLEIQRRMLGRVAANEPLPEILEEIAGEMGAHSAEGALVSILLFDETGKHLRLAGAPRLPELYKKAIDNISIGATAEPCSTAAFNGIPVYLSI